MNKKVIIIEGYLASGKSTFAVRLSKALNIPYFVKDTFKTALCAGVQITGREESSRFSAITFDAMMYTAERLFETGCPFIMEGNFAPRGVKKTDEAGVIKTLIEKYDYLALNFKFRGDTRILHKRFTEREKSPERGQANVMFTEISLTDFDKICHNLDNFNIGGKIIQIDTSDFETADFGKHMDTARSFLAETGQRPV